MIGGSTFGRYELLRRLAFGGMAEIFLAALRGEEGFEKRVVLKRILPQYSADTAFVKMFIDEAVLAARITHPNVVQVYDFGNVDGVYYIAMEYVDGVDLRRVLKGKAGRATLSAAEVAAIGEGVARGLTHAHNLVDDEGAPLGIVHRDVSPHNIMLSRAGDAKLMDFGIAKAEARLTRTSTGTIKGKVAYMAPEQAAGKPIDRRSDEFALGLVLWECLSGERMFSGDSDLEVLQKVARCELRDLHHLRPDAPEPLVGIISRCLMADPDDRYADLDEVAHSLAAFRFSLGTDGAVSLGGLVEVAAGASTGRSTRELSDPAPASSWSEESSSVAAAAAESLTAPVPAPSFADDGRLPTASTARTDQAPDQTADRPGPPRRRIWWAASIAVGVVAASFALAVGLRSQRQASDELAQVRIESTPPGAIIILNGLDSGLSTPVTIPDQGKGRPFRLELRADGYKPWMKVVTPTRDMEQVSATLIPHKSPTDAPRSLSGGKGSSVPAVDSVPLGSSHALQAAAHRAQGSSAPAAASPSPQKKTRPLAKTMRQHRRLGSAKSTKSPNTRQTGRLFLRSSGAWVDVYLGDRKLGTTPLAGVAVPAGTLRLRLVNKSAGIDRAFVVDVKRGETVRRTVTPGN